MGMENLAKVVNVTLASIGYKFSNKEKVFEALLKVDRADFAGEGVLDAMIIGADNYLALTAVHNRIVDVEDGGLVDNLNSNAVDYISAVEKLLMEVRQVKIPMITLAYNDLVIQLGHGQTCTQPSVNCILLDASGLEEEMNILEIGTGSGYFAALAAEMLGEKGFVTTMERIPELIDPAHANLRKHFGDNYARRVHIIGGNGKNGYFPHAPYDRIILTAGVDIETFDKKPFIEQLKPNASLIYPEQKGYLYSEKYKSGVMVDQKIHGRVMFVPLITEEPANI